MLIPLGLIFYMGILEEKNYIYSLVGKVLGTGRQEGFPKLHLKNFIHSTNSLTQQTYILNAYYPHAWDCCSWKRIKIEVNREERLGLELKTKQTKKLPREAERGAHSASHERMGTGHGDCVARTLRGTCQRAGAPQVRYLQAKESETAGSHAEKPSTLPDISGLCEQLHFPLLLQKGKCRAKMQWVPKGRAGFTGSPRMNNIALPLHLQQVGS